MSLKSLDIFGVEFKFRDEKYEKFKTKTGGCFFILYLIGIFSYFLWGILNYIENSIYEMKHFQIESKRLRRPQSPGPPYEVASAPAHSPLHPD